MKFKRKTMRIVSGMLTAITLFTNALSPVIAYAAPADEADVESLITRKLKISWIRMKW